MDSLEVYMDPFIRESTGIWADVNPSALNRLDQLDIDKMASIHAAGNLCKQVKITNMICA